MFAREGYPFILGAAALAAIAFAMALKLRSWPMWLAALALTIVALWVAWFFRNPTRVGERGAGVAIAPVDGRIVLIANIVEPTFVQGPTLRVSSFMNVFDVHVNRYPVDGVVKHVQHKAGQFLNAVPEASSSDNGQVSVGIETGERTVAGQMVIADLCVA